MFAIYGVFVVLGLLVCALFVWAVVTSRNGVSVQSTSLGRAGHEVPVPDPVLPKPAPQEITISVFQHHGGFEQTDQDVRFERRIYEECNYVIEKMFYAKVAGVTFPNADGSARLPVVRRCRVGEILVLLADDSLAEFPDTVGIHRLKGGQLGYLDAQLAGEVRRHGLASYGCIFRRKLYKPGTKSVAGAVLCIVRFERKV